MLLLAALGVPLSWGKLRIGTRLNWLGLTLDLAVPAWLLPPSKMRRILQFLDEVLLVLAKPTFLEFDRQTFEQGTGLLLWVAELRRELRPRLAALYHALTAQTSTLVSVSPDCWANRLLTLDATVPLCGHGLGSERMTHAPRPSNSPKIWSRQYSYGTRPSG